MGWLGLLVYMMVAALMTLLLAALFVLEWVASVVLSLVVLMFRVAARKEFLVRAKLSGYIGAHKPSDGRVTVGPPGRPILRPVRVEWRRESLFSALSARQEMADHIQASQFADPTP